jgi:hypothetical protein
MVEFLQWFGSIAHNVLGIAEGGEIEAIHCQPSRNFVRSINFEFSTLTPLLGIPY